MCRRCTARNPFQHRWGLSKSFAWDEGEGDRTRAWWLSAHEAFFRRYLATVGLEFDPEMVTVFERFEVLFAE